VNERRRSAQHEPVIFSRTGRGKIRYFPGDPFQKAGKFECLLSSALAKSYQLRRADAGRDISHTEWNENNVGRAAIERILILIPLDRAGKRAQFPDSTDLVEIFRPFSARGIILVAWSAYR
jgi:hypothetical protein